MKEKGQGLVEFAVILPLLIMLTISIIYIGAMFLDYQQYSNAARDAARDISLQTKTTDNATAYAQRENMVKQLNGEVDGGDELKKRYVNPITSLYQPTWTAQLLKSDGQPATNDSEAVDVQIKISLKRSEGALVFGNFMTVLPEELKPIIFNMKLEESVTVTN